MKRAGAGIVIVVAIVLLIFTLSFETFTYASNDMAPTIAQNETIVVSKRIDNIERGDIVLFKYPADQSQMFVKRVVGLPGDVVAIKEGRLFVGGEVVAESYLTEKALGVARSFPETQIPAGSYYVLGDNRDASNDSRMWGPLSGDLIVGKVMFK